MTFIPAYVGRARLLAELDICDRTLDNWIAKGFPRAGRNGRWNWEKVRAHMDGPKDAGVASGAADREAELREMVDHGHETHVAKNGRNFLCRARRIRGKSELHQDGADDAGQLSAHPPLGA